MSGFDPKWTFRIRASLLPMNPQNLFHLAAVGVIALPCIVAGATALLSRPKRLPLRVMSAIFAGWVVAVYFTEYAYNPAGIAAGIDAGVDPEMRFDNNALASAILHGWMYPAMAVAMVLSVRALIRKVRPPARRA
ncbi:hypothetical protein [Lysobacter helvus]|nr:hypothetical protein [Lysobacter helvus]